MLSSLTLSLSLSLTQERKSVPGASHVFPGTATKGRAWAGSRVSCSRVLQDGNLSAGNGWTYR